MIGRIRTSLRLRAVVAIVGVVVLTASGVGALVSISARSWIYQDAQERELDIFTQEINNVGTIWMSTPRDPASTSPTRPASDWARIYPDDAIVAVDGIVVSDPLKQAADIPAGMRQYVEGNPGLYRFSRLSNSRVAIGYRAQQDRLTGHGESVFVVRSLGEVSQRVNHLMWLVVGSVLAAAAIGVIVGLALIRSVLRPLRTVTDTAARVAAGDADARMSSTDIAELSDLTRTFNDMLDKHEHSLTVLREQEQRAQRFVADVSHELRSPLAALVPAAEVLDEEIGDDKDVRGQAARLVRREVTALTALVDDLLEMTRRDAGVAEVERVDVDLPELITAALEQRGWADVPVTSPQPYRLVTDPRRVIAIVTNLVANAIRHGRRPVTVHIVGSAGAATVSVRDRGDGIADEHLPQVFDRMYKASGARTRSGGAGLGLAIARENARLLGGDVRYSRENEVTVFTATFVSPAAQ